MNVVFMICVIALVVVLILTSYVKAPPAVAFIISGLSKEPRVLIGKGGFKIPFLERLDKVYLGQITVDIKTETSVPTNDFINVDVDAVAKIRVEPNIEGTRLAAKNFLNMTPGQIAEQVQDSLQGNMREIIGTLDLKGLNTDRDGFSDEVMKKASPDMKKLGIEVISCNIQNVTDKDGLIYALGADNTAKIKKDAAITKANADREVAVAVAKASQEANEAQVASKTAIAEQNNALALKQAELKRLEDTQQAIADAAYAIQQQEQQLTINVKTVDAEIAQTKRMQALTEEQVLIKQNTLTAQINKEADAKKYQTEIEAAAALEQRKRNAEAEKYEAEQKAEAVKKQADAARYAAEQEAAGIKARGRCRSSSY